MPQIPTAGSLSKLLALLGQGEVIVTANTRARRALLSQYASAQRANGARAWTAPSVYDWDSWLELLREQLQFEAPSSPLRHMPLGPLQEHELWKKIIRESESGGLLLTYDSIAKLAQQAYGLLWQYSAQSQLRFRWGADDTDEEIFRTWALGFDRVCNRNHWLPRARLTHAVVEALGQSTGLRPQIYLFGFSRFTPAQRSLLDTWAAWTDLQEEDASLARRATYHSYRSLSDELTVCTQEIRAWTQRNPNDRLALIVPGVAERRGHIERALKKNLDPNLAKYEFSLGVALASTSIVRAFLLMLRWPYQPLKESELQWLISSGALAKNDVEQHELANANRKLRLKKKQRAEWPIEVFLDYPQINKTAVAKRLSKLKAIIHNLATLEQSPAHWSLLSTQWLTSSECPGLLDRHDSSFQVKRRWQAALDNAASTTAIHSTMGLPHFVDMLTLYCKDLIFAERSDNATLQIMEPFEAAGQFFDATWFLSAEEQTWPPSGSPAPFLPRSIQKQAGMPHASAAIDYEVAKVATTSILSTSAEVRFSYSTLGTLGESLRPSRLITAVAGEAQEVPPVETEVHSTMLDELSEEGAPSIAANAVVRGGTSIFKHQSACPFRAFATLRLHAETPQVATLGLSSLQRGQLLHWTMEVLWRELQSSLRLKTLSPDERDRIIDESVEIAFHNLLEDDRTRWRNTYLALERKRLRRLVMQWLTKIEVERKPFTVEKLEHEINTKLGGIEFNLRVDRIDKVQVSDTSSAFLVIDYKTGKASPSQWETSRPEEPQLPIYAVTPSEYVVDGIAFAQIRNNGMSFKGLTIEELASSGLKNGLDDHTRKDWLNVLTNLATDYLAGVATVDPRDGDACKHCDLGSLCRVAETDARILEMLNEDATSNSHAIGRQE